MASRGDERRLPRRLAIVPCNYHRLHMSNQTSQASRDGWGSTTTHLSIRYPVYIGDSISKTCYVLVIRLHHLSALQIYRPLDIDVVKAWMLI